MDDISVLITKIYFGGVIAWTLCPWRKWFSMTKAREEGISPLALDIATTIFIMIWPLALTFIVVTGHIKPPHEK